MTTIICIVGRMLTLSLVFRSWYVMWNLCWIQWRLWRTKQHEEQGLLSPALMPLDMKYGWGNIRNSQLTDPINDLIFTTLLDLEYSLVYISHSMDGLVQDDSISSADALEILQSCTKPSTYHHDVKSLVFKCFSHLSKHEIGASGKVYQEC